ncbi:MAG: hypothetical protein HYY46_00060 [Deltaproteobacteria bacterium]|nr:hypothetical protein [Deltaproteobacteria bacterium]
MGLETGSPEYTPGLTLDEKLASLFQPDTLVSAQYFQNLRRSTVLEPEKRLMLAVLEDAIQCFQDNVSARSGRGKRLFEEGEEWILEEDIDWIFSFESICEVLGFNPEYVRQGLLRWKERKLAKHAHAKAWETRRWLGKLWQAIRRTEDHERSSL